MMITGIVLSRHVQLAVMSEEVPSAAKDQSIEMRMRRWVKLVSGDYLYLTAEHAEVAEGHKRSFLCALCDLCGE